MVHHGTMRASKNPVFSVSITRSCNLSDAECTCLALSPVPIVANQIRQWTKRHEHERRVEIKTEMNWRKRRNAQMTKSMWSTQCSSTWSKV